MTSVSTDTGGHYTVLTRLHAQGPRQYIHGPCNRSGPPRNLTARMSCEILSELPAVSLTVRVTVYWPGALYSCSAVRHWGPNML